METTQLLVDGAVRQRKKCKLAKHVWVVQYLWSAVGAKAFMCSFIASLGAGSERGQWLSSKSGEKKEKYVENSNVRIRLLTG